jgi:hypothetical protein
VSSLALEKTPRDSKIVGRTDLSSGNFSAGTVSLAARMKNFKKFLAIGYESVNLAIACTPTGCASALY